MKIIKVLNPNKTFPKRGKAKWTKAKIRMLILMQKSFKIIEMIESSHLLRCLTKVLISKTIRISK